MSMLTLILSLFLAATPSSEDVLHNWHQWRGPLATGVAPTADPPLKWNAQTNIKWKTPIPGKGSATPIVWGDRIFIPTAVDAKRPIADSELPKIDPRFERKTQSPGTYHQFIVLCIDRQTGKVRWQQVATEQVPHEGHHPTHSYAAASSTTDGKYLYVSFGSRRLYCYDLDGHLQWQRDLGKMITRLGWGEGISPVIHG